MESNEYRGYWWLPSAPENKTPGAIRISTEDSLTLNLLGTLENPRLPKRYSTDFYKIVLGITEEGKLFTLYQCLRLNASFNSPGIRTETYTINTVFHEVHFNKINQMKFHKAVVDYSCLSSWVYSGNPKFLHRWHKDLAASNIYNLIDLNWSSLELVAKTTKGNVSIFPMLFSSTHNLSFNFKKAAKLKIDFSQETTLESCYFDYLYPLQNFLTLATNENNFIVDLHVYSNYGLRNSNIADNETPIKVSSSFVSQEPKESSKDNMLFTLENIENELSLWMQKWFNIGDDLRHICNIFFGVKYLTDIFGEQRFLSIVQAIESYHRICFRNEVVPGAEFKRRREEILENTLEEHREWLNEKLVHANEPSLQNRLNDLVEKYKGVIEPFINEDQSKFTKKVKNTRNYLTHYNKSLKKKTAEGDELFRLTQILSFLLEACLLHELGCTPERCAELINRSNEYKYTVKFVREANFDWSAS